MRPDGVNTMKIDKDILAYVSSEKRDSKIVEGTEETTVGERFSFEEYMVTTEKHPDRKSVV